MDTYLLPIMGLLASLGAAPESPAARADVRVTQKYLSATCLDGAPVKAAVRRFRLAPGPHLLSFTMGHDAKGGFATVRFTAEAGHRYEVEGHAAATAFSSGTFEAGGWKPVVRDRTVDHAVSGDPEWGIAACPSGTTAPDPPVH